MKKTNKRVQEFIRVDHAGERGAVKIYEGQLLALNTLVKDEILNSLQEIRISCKDVAFRIFDLSLTTYNMMLSLIMFLISMKIYIINNGIKK